MIFYKIDTIGFVNVADSNELWLTRNFLHRVKLELRGIMFNSCLKIGSFKRYKTGYVWFD